MRKETFTRQQEMKRHSDFDLVLVLLDQYVAFCAVVLMCLSLMKSEPSSTDVQLLT